jgi:hypothetical protein
LNETRRYLQSRKKAIGLFLILETLVSIILLLSGVTLRVLAYPMGLSAALFVVYGVYDYVCFRRKLNQLRHVREHVDVTLDNLPEPGCGLEQEYQKLLDILFERKQQELLKQQESKNELTEYVTIWTHQVKTPLTAVQMIAGEMEEPQKGELTARIFEIEQYCDMMLQYLRLENDTTDYVLKAYSVREMVNQSVRYFARIFISKGISLQVEIPEECRIVTDEKWMVFVLKQLISNALKYTPKGSITIDMPDARHIRIADTGIGIAPEDLPRIFDRGYTGYNGRRDKKATGLGLFLVKNILTKLGAEITVRSEVEQGTEVLIGIPYKSVRMQEEM